MWTVASRLQLLACFGAAVGACGTAKGPPATAVPTAVVPTSTAQVPRWLYHFPLNCALGDSGPTLKPADALAEARRQARARLAMANAKIDVKAIAVTTGNGAVDEHKEVTLQQGEGWTTRSSIAGMWYDADGVGPEHAVGSAYAVACGPDGRGQTSSWLAKSDLGHTGPAWIYDLPHETGRTCAVGFSGPTLEAAEADQNAEDSAREQLAEAIALRATTTMAMFDNDEVLYGAITEACATCAQTAEKGRVVGRWRDERGEGPLPYPGTSYALLCIDG